jgi:hypothetical protein
MGLSVPETVQQVLATERFKCDLDYISQVQGSAFTNMTPTLGNIVLSKTLFTGGRTEK